jgi:hypothetical protein
MGVVAEAGELARLGHLGRYVPGAVPAGADDFERRAQRRSAGAALRTRPKGGHFYRPASTFVVVNQSSIGLYVPQPIKS